LAFSSRYIEKSEAEPPEESGGLPPSVKGFFIYTVPVAGGEVKRLTDSASGEPEEIQTGLDARAGHVSWSPDGKKLAFTAIKGGEEELWLMENFLPESTVGK